MKSEREDDTDMIKRGGKVSRKAFKCELPSDLDLKGRAEFCRKGSQEGHLRQKEQLVQRQRGHKVLKGSGRVRE